MQLLLKMEVFLYVAGTNLKLTNVNTKKLLIIFNVIFHLKKITKAYAKQGRDLPSKAAALKKKLIS